jgi:hypothetical protein
MGALTHAGDPLPSWNDGPAKQAIVGFVQATTTPGNLQFVPPAGRIATFDQASGSGPAIRYAKVQESIAGWNLLVSNIELTCALSARPHPLTRQI